MRVLFVINTLGFVRHFDRVVADRVGRGHRVTLGVTDQDGQRLGLPEALRDLSSVRVVEAPFERVGQLRGPVRLLRALRDYLRYHEAPFDEKDAYRARAFERIQHASFGGAQSTTDRTGPICARFTPEESRRVQRLLEILEGVVPTDAVYDRFLHSERPDVVLVTPLVWFGSPLVDIVKSAQ
ncbi:MAG: hypothetical protein VYE68_14355 [Acidobacteriota bacterium]|nr:hypothetical protein [Acidobacteriota bacterium]